MEDGHKLALFLKLTYLEGKRRRKFFDRYPMKVLYVSSGRLSCAKNGEWGTKTMNGVAYGWYLWEKGFHGDPIIKWFN